MVNDQYINTQTTALQVTLANGLPQYKARFQQKLYEATAVMVREARDSYKRKKKQGIQVISSNPRNGGALEPNIQWYEETIEDSPFPEYSPVYTIMISDMPKGTDEVYKGLVTEMVKGIETSQLKETPVYEFEELFGEIETQLATEAQEEMTIQQILERMASAES